MLPTLPRPGSGLQTVPGTGPVLRCVHAGALDPAVFADAVARWRALERLRGFRRSLYECLDARADALFQLADAVLCADHAVTSLVQLRLEPEFTRGHGALYDALAAGRIDDERFFSLLTSELPRAAAGPEARAWIAGHDVIDHGLLEAALAGLSGTQLSQHAGWLSSKVSKIEHGKQTPSEDDLRVWCEHCHALDELPDLVAGVRSVETQFAEWRRIVRSGTRRRQQASAAVYERARLFRIYEPAVVPGLLQTHDYAVAVLSSFIDFVRVPDDAEEGAAARLERLRVLTHGDRHFHMVLGEQALHTNVGGTGVMTGQLEHLLTVPRLRRLRLGIIPFDAPYRVPLNNGFWILDEGLVQFDTYTAELSVIRPDEIALYGRAFERLAALAVYGAEAKGIIARTLDQLARKVLEQNQADPLARYRPNSGGVQDPV